MHAALQLCESTLLLPPPLRGCARVRAPRAEGRGWRSVARDGGGGSVWKGRGARRFDGAVRGFGRGWCRTTSSVRKRSRHAPPAEANDGSGQRCGVRPASMRQHRRRHMLCAELRWRPAAQRHASVRASQAAMYCGIWMRACCATSRSVMSLTAGVSCVAHGHAEPREPAPGLDWRAASAWLSGAHLRIEPHTAASTTDQCRRHARIGGSSIYIPRVCYVLELDMHIL